MTNGAPNRVKSFDYIKKKFHRSRKRSRERTELCDIAKIRASVVEQKGRNPN